MEGDIIPTEEETKSITFGTPIKGQQRRWPKGIVPYVIDSRMGRYSIIMEFMPYTKCLQIHAATILIFSISNIFLCGFRESNLEDFIAEMVRSTHYSIKDGANFTN